jgi:CheY-like chemotaxis protein/anti-sigma regulatory factor (Ser/Thr protein kinase)
VLLNLLSNAVKFTHKGEVVVSARLLSSDGLMDLIEITVKDTGIGIPESYRGDLFKAFRQADSSTTREYGGTGLGLTIVQRLVDLMGGRIDLESVVGKGSTFTVVLPLERAEPRLATTSGVEAALPLAVDFAQQHPARILVVEDDPVNTRLVCEVLQRMGYKPDTASDGYKALALLAENRHDLVLMDMQMPRMDGIETTRHIRSGQCGEAVRSIGIIAVTALALQEERERIMRSGVDAYLSKPLQPEALRKTIIGLADRLG